jgi:branched-chain amino acid transport system permease protein
MIIQKSTIVVGGLGSIAGSVLGATAIILLLELLREVKGLQEIVFGALLVVFVLYMRGGIVSILRRYIPGWEEPLHPKNVTRASVSFPEGETQPSPVVEK